MLCPFCNKEGHYEYKNPMITLEDDVMDIVNIVEKMEVKACCETMTKAIKAEKIAELLKMAQETLQELE